MSKVRVLEKAATVAKAIDRGTHWNFRCSEELQESLQRSQRRRLYVNSFLLQFDGAQGLFEFPDKLILKPSTTHSTGSITQPLLHWFCPLCFNFISKFSLHFTFRTGTSSSLLATSRGSPASVFSRSLPRIFTP